VWAPAPLHTVADAELKSKMSVATGNQQGKKAQRLGVFTSQLDLKRATANGTQQQLDAESALNDSKYCVIGIVGCVSISTIYVPHHPKNKLARPRGRPDVHGDGGNVVLRLVVCDLAGEKEEATFIVGTTNPIILPTISPVP